MNKNEKVLLKVRNVKKYFNTPGGIVKAIDDVSFDVNQGEIVGLIGESGSGKTTVGRCLIRLYDKFSGFVSLDNQTISGDKLSKRKKRYLNQNMQMIFQDPHASLNTQHNIYTILKEPLIVNKIMKEENKDFFKDWNNVIENFRYEFREENKRLELDTITYHTQQAFKLFNEWKNVFHKIKFKYQDIENDFNQYFAFKISTQERETNVIARMFENNSKLIDFYFKKQKNYRNNEIIPTEQKLKNQREHIEKLIAESKISHFEKIKQSKVEIEKQKLRELIQFINDEKINHLSILNSHIKAFKNEAKEALQNARKQDYYEKYNVHIKRHLLSNRMKDELKRHKNILVYLSSQEIDEMVLEFKKYQKKFENESSLKFKNKNYKKVKQEFSIYIKNEFNFVFIPFLKKSKEIFEKIQNRINNSRLVLNYYKGSFKSHHIGHNNKTHSKIKQAEKEYHELKITYQKEIEEYLVSYNERMNVYNESIEKQKQQLEIIRSNLKILEQQFEKKHKEFIFGLKRHLVANIQNKKTIENKINLFENRIKSKNESLKTFNIEVQNLQKDKLKLEYLLGIKKHLLSKKFIKKLLINEKIYKSLEDVGLLRQFAWRYPHEFSGGQRQRIVIARALISNPKVIVADEPIASLDVSIQAQIVNILKDLCEKKNVSLIFIAHDLSMVEYIADKILIMHLGKIVEMGKTEKIYSNPVHPYTINLFKSIPKISNANDKFESSNFELDYLEEQNNSNSRIDFFNLEDDHIIYSTLEQFRKWTNKNPLNISYINGEN